MKLVARTHQTLIWDRSRQLLRLRSVLREFFPAALHAFDELTAPDALELWAAPRSDPDRAARLSRSQIGAALRRAHRRDVEAKASRLQELLRTPQRSPAPPAPAASCWPATPATAVSPTRYTSGHSAP